MKNLARKVIFGIFCICLLAPTSFQLGNYTLLTAPPPQGNVPNCATYSAFGSCAKCEENYFLVDDAHTQCSQCQSPTDFQYFLRLSNSASTCSKCNNAPSPKKGVYCTQCMEGSYYNASNGTCAVCPAGCERCNSDKKCLDCNIGEYFDTTQKKCLSCGENCRECDGLTNKCIKCFAGLGLGADGKCELC